MNLSTITTNAPVIASIIFSDSPQSRIDCEALRVRVCTDSYLPRESGPNHGGLAKPAFNIKYVGSRLVDQAWGTQAIAALQYNTTHRGDTPSTEES